jgi:hypothetical protein
MEWCVWWRDEMLCMVLRWHPIRLASARTLQRADRRVLTMRRRVSALNGRFVMDGEQRSGAQVVVRNNRVYTNGATTQ